MSLKRTSPEPLTSRLQLVKMYPTDPLSDGSAFIEYVVLKRGFGDLDIPKCSPLGTLKSRRAVLASGRCPAYMDRGLLTIGRPREVGIEVVLIPASLFVVAAKNVGRERMHRDMDCGGGVQENEPRHWFWSMGVSRR